ncbi:dTDP-4-dehydrorhamnose 3,5-epimerase family protein [Rhodococcus sp. I2R]|uniref:dTDP-4-dehydrorhamnose 3,5-epimerase family protein n=1 Tax=Rhodococcus sp. I2R TaxID=2855445 RepID=UPI001E56D1FE|nr:dTDP-4-dehydrorhamnose 3,5-epimerase family protein [Rhodococcus sp. I2R]MCC8926582.1 dTDP-4-dehydrorhamnose 3,5-epimerase family protein [Rhodococcus sp. I2R]
MTAVGRRPVLGTRIDGVEVLRADAHHDERGSFATQFTSTGFVERTGRPLFPVREISHNVSMRGVLRGIHHTSVLPGRAKYVYCPRGHTEHFLVDLRTDSATFGGWQSVTLTGAAADAIYVPIGVGHGLLSLEDNSVVGYLMSAPYKVEQEQSVSALDPRIGLPLPVNKMQFARSERDCAAPTLEMSLQSGLLPNMEQCRRAEKGLYD